MHILIFINAFINYEHIKMWVKDYFIPESHQTKPLLYSFLLGIVFAPFTWGFVFFILYCIIYEICILIACKKCECEYDLIYRLVINLFAISGWVFGRIIFVCAYKPDCVLFPITRSSTKRV